MEKINDLAKMKLQRWIAEDKDLKVDSGDTNYQDKVGNMKQGEVEFTGLKGHRAQYLITPPEMEDPEKVLMHMFGRPREARTRNLPMS